MKHLLALAMIALSLSAGAQKTEQRKSIHIQDPNLAQGLHISGTYSLAPASAFNDTFYLTPPARRIKTFKVTMLVSDTSKKGSLYTIVGYAVRELHNEAEGQIDPGFYMGRVWKDYWQHIRYTYLNRKPLSAKIHVWQSVDMK